MFVIVINTEKHSINLFNIIIMTTFTTTFGTFSYDETTQYLSTDTVSGDQLKDGDIICQYGGIFELYNRSEFEGWNGTTGYHFEAKRIDPKPWNPYYSDLVNDNLGWQGNNKATAARWNGKFEKYNR